MQKTLVFFYLLAAGLISQIGSSSKVQATVILQYHHIAENTPKSTSLSPALFEQHLDYLRDNNYKILSLHEFVRLLGENEALPAKSVVITFDDGYRSIYENAYPLLKKRNMPFSVFINTQPLIDNLPQFMSWQELMEMSESGASIVNHSVTHPHLIRRKSNESDTAWTERIKSEIKDAQSLIGKKLGKTLKVFAYPFGEYDRHIQKIVTDLGFLGFSQHSGAVSKDTDLSAIPRFPFGGSYGGMEDFKVKVSSLAMPLASVDLIGNNGQLLDDHLLSNDNLKPSIRLNLKRPFEHLNIQCFLSGYGRLEIEAEKSSRIVASPVELNPGRSRINCTAPTGEGNQFYWFSQTWIVRNRDGSWYQE